MADRTASTSKRLIPAILLVAYGAIVLKLMVFKINLIRIGHLRIRLVTHSGPPNLTPFKSILADLHGEPSRTLAILNLVGNIALLVPVGFLAPFAFPGMTWRSALALGLAAGLTIETMELVFQVGIFDVDDIMLNAAGVMLGFAASGLLRRPPRRGVAR